MRTHNRFSRRCLVSISVPAATAACALLLAACGSSSDAPGLEPGEECRKNEDCTSGALCIEFVCRTVCSGADQCAPPLGCRAGVCQPCSADEHCPGALACDVDTGECRASCAGDEDCKSVAYCGADGACVAHEEGAVACERGWQCASANCLLGRCCPEGCATECTSDGVCLRADGDACDTDADCVGGRCVDRTCCAETCDGACETCAGTVPGVCEPVASGSDFDSCATTCNDGVCWAPSGAALGEACDSGAECLSGFCADGVCCDSACKDLCRSCNLAASAGTCSPVVMQEYGDCSSSPARGLRMCDMDGVCQGPHLLVDINKTDPSRDFVELASGKVLFVANSSTMGRELWVYDPATEDAHVLEDIMPGLGSSGIAGLTLDASRAGVFFTADDGFHGRELWYSDGEEVRLFDLVLGRDSGAPTSLVRAGSSVYGVSAGALWRVDRDSTERIPLPSGTGTTPVAIGSAVYLTGPGNPAVVFESGSFSTAAESPSAPIEANGVYYFAGRTASEGAELWRSAGPQSSAVMVRDVCAGACNGLGWPSPAIAATPNGLVFFLGDDAGGSTPRQLWVSDGDPSVAATNTKPLVSFTNCTLADLTAAGSSVYFVASCGSSDQLWVSAASLSALPVPVMTASAIGQLLSVGSYLYFVAADSTHGFELWRTGGEFATTRMLDVNPGAGSSDIAYLGRDGSRLFFAGKVEGEGQTLWACDDTAVDLTEACAMLDPMPGPSSSAITSQGGVAGMRDAIVTSAGRMLFAALTEEGQKYALWSVGGGAPLRRLAVLYSGANGSAASEFVPLSSGRDVFLIADDGLNLRVPMFVSKGAISSLKDPNSGRVLRSASAPVAIGNVVYFLAEDGARGIELWRTDGSDTGTFLVKDIDPSPGASGFVATRRLFAWNGRIFFAGTDADHGAEPWVSDGTEEGTVMLKDIVPGGDSYPSLFTVFNGWVYFTARVGTRYELWATDGSVPGTLKVSNVAGGAAFVPQSMVATDERLYYAQQVPRIDNPIWATNCAPGDTCPTLECSQLNDAKGACPLAATVCLWGAVLTAASNRVLFGADGGDAYCMLGIASSTGIGYLTGATVDPIRLAMADGVVFGISMLPSGQPRRLFLSDLKTITPVPTSNSLFVDGTLTAFGRRVLYSAPDGELVVSDGSLEGTFKACPGRIDCKKMSSPTVVDGRLYMTLTGPLGAEPAVFP